MVDQEEISTPPGDFYIWLIKTQDPITIGIDSLYDYITGEAWVKKVLVSYFYADTTTYKFRETIELKNIDWGRK